ncbi:MAG: 2'-5' RNA ligase family protein [Candidatus Aenigmatarchaeota archaeon]
MVDLVICLKLPNDFEKYVIKAKKEISKKFKNVKFTEQPPHSILFLGNFKEKKLSQIEKELINICNNTKSFYITFNGPKILDDKINKSKGIVFIADNNINLRNFQKKIIETLNDYRNKEYIYDFIANALPRFSKKERINIKKYGYPYSWNNFIIHVSICSVSENFKNVFNYLKKYKNTFKFKVKGIVVYRLVQKKIFEIKWLKKIYNFKI